MFRLGMYPLPIYKLLRLHDFCPVNILRSLDYKLRVCGNGDLLMWDPGLFEPVWFNNTGSNNNLHIYNATAKIIVMTLGGSETTHR